MRHWPIGKFNSYIRRRRLRVPGLPSGPFLIRPIRARSGVELGLHAGQSHRRQRNLSTTTGMPRVAKWEEFVPFTSTLPETVDEADLVEIGKSAKREPLSRKCGRLT